MDGSGYTAITISDTTSLGRRSKDYLLEVATANGGEERLNDAVEQVTERPPQKFNAWVQENKIVDSLSHFEHLSASERMRNELDCVRHLVIPIFQGR